MPFFIPPALMYGGIAALGAGARAINSPTGQNIIRGGINLFNKGVNKIANTTLGSLPQYAQSLATGTKFAPTNTSVMGNVVGPALTAPYLANPKEGLDYASYFTPYATEALNQITGGDETGIVSDLDESLRPMITDLMESLLDSDTKDTEKKDKKKKKEKKEDKKDKKKETKKNKEPSIDDLPLDAEEAKKKKNLKKGGYVKKQRKRKPYKSSSFAKMKKSKKRKYI